MNYKGNIIRLCIAYLVISFVNMPLYSRYKNKGLKAKNVDMQQGTNQVNIDKNTNQEVTTNQTKATNEPLTLQEIECKPTQVACPTSIDENDENLIDVNLENTDLQNILAWISDTFQVNFLTFDALQPIPQGGKAVIGNKVTFKTHKPLTKKQVWELFLTFLDLFGFSLVAESIPNTYKVLPTAPNAPNSVNKSPLDSYINVSWKELPDSDIRIRYVYFIKNSSLAILKNIVDAFRSNTATLHDLQELNAFIITDKASNIRSIMQIIEDLDRVTSPEAMSVLKLRSADAEDVVKLYEALVKREAPQLAARVFGPKKQPTSVYFPENVRLIAEARTNTLIILGDAIGIKKIEDFIIKYVDVELRVPYSPLYVYELEYVNAEDMARLLTDVTKFAAGSSAARAGGIREGDKYLQPMIFQPEPAGNRLLIKAEKEDYLKVRDIIMQLDVKQPQVALEVLIVNVLTTDNRELGVQIRNKDDNTISKNLNFQASGLPLLAGKARPVVDPNTGSLVANLISLAQNQSPGSTLISIANPVNGVWGIFKILQSAAHTNIIANPFLITTNKYEAQVSIGETRRVVTAQVVSTAETNARGDVSANLTVKITPQINTIGVINLDIDISIDTFVDSADPESANKDVKTIKTNANVANNEVLALGGLLKTNQDEVICKVPVLGDVPLLGWFFKSKTKTIRKDNLLIFISPRILEPKYKGGTTKHTDRKADLARRDMRDMHVAAERRDPIHRWFFQDSPRESIKEIDNFIEQKHRMATVGVPKSMVCDTECFAGEIAKEVPIDKEEICEPCIEKVPSNYEIISPKEKSTFDIPTAAPPSLRQRKTSIINMLSSDEKEGAQA